MITGKLTFYPIAKNLYILAIGYYASIQKNITLEFTEDYILNDEKSFYPKNFNGDSWTPWLWSRIDRRNSNTKTGWELYFNQWKNNAISKLQNINKENSVIQYGKCVDQIFQPNDYVMKFIEEYKFRTDKKRLCIVVRRGDCKNLVNKIVKCKSVDYYAKYIKKYNPKEYDIYVSSDSIDIVLPELQELLPEYTFHYSKYSSKLDFLPSDGSDIEGFCQKNPQYIETVIISALIDLYNIRSCEAFIGPYKHSLFSRVGILLIIGRLGYLPKNDIIDISEDVDPVLTLSKMVMIDNKIM